MDGTRTHKAVFCRVRVDLDGELGSRARRPQAFRGLIKGEFRKRPRDEGRCEVGEGELDVKWRRWNENAESYLKEKEGVTGRKFSGRGFVGREVCNTMSAPQDRGYGCALDSEAKHRRDRLARICETERLKAVARPTDKQLRMIYNPGEEPGSYDAEEMSRLQELHNTDANELRRKRAAAWKDWNEGQWSSGGLSTSGLGTAVIVLRSDCLAVLIQ